MNLPRPELEREPVRWAVWLAALGAIVVGSVVQFLWGVPWRPVLAHDLTVIGPMLFGSEVARGAAWSPASVWEAVVAGRADEATRAGVAVAVAQAGDPVPLDVGEAPRVPVAEFQPPGS